MNTTLEQLSEQGFRLNRSYFEEDNIIPVISVYERGYERLIYEPKTGEVVITYKIDGKENER